MSYGLVIKNSNDEIRFDQNSEMLRVYYRDSVTFNNAINETKTIYFPTLPYVPQVSIEVNQLIESQVDVIPYTNKVDISLSSTNEINGLIIDITVLRI